ncbi:MAG: right-handed parallel beta-helix repeat-containing protein [Armatimonadota bacterium]
MSKHKVLIWSLVFLVILCSSCFGQTIIRVSTGGNDSSDGSSWTLAKKTIQAGINAASPNGGGEIWVAAGTYSEHITLKANCYLYGGFAGTESQRTERDFSVNKSIIDGTQNGNVVSASGLSAIACVDGFTIRNSGSSYYGIYCYSSSPTITNNTINGNGGGICCYVSKPTISNNTICGNGSGIGCIAPTNPTITNNTISGNSCGIFCTESSPKISNNTISGNGFGVHCGASSRPIITNNTISENDDGVFCDGSSSPTIASNMISKNDFGIHCYYASSPVIINNTINGNSYGVDCVSSSPTITNNTINGNRGLYFVKRTPS